MSDISSRPSKRQRTADASPNDKLTTRRTRTITTPPSRTKTATLEAASPSASPSTRSSTRRDLGSSHRLRRTVTPSRKANGVAPGGANRSRRAAPVTAGDSEEPSDPEPEPEPKARKSKGVKRKAEDVEVPQSQKKPSWRGWVKLGDDEVVSSKHDELERIRLEAIQDAIQDEAGVGTKSLRSRKSASSLQDAPKINGTSKRKQRKQSTPVSSKKKEAEPKAKTPPRKPVERRSGRSFEKTARTRSPPIIQTDAGEQKERSRDSTARVERVAQNGHAEEHKRRSSELSRQILMHHAGVPRLSPRPSPRPSSIPSPRQSMITSPRQSLIPSPRQSLIPSPGPPLGPSLRPTEIRTAIDHYGRQLDARVEALNRVDEHLDLEGLIDPMLLEQQTQNVIPDSQPVPSQPIDDKSQRLSITETQLRPSFNKLPSRQPSQSVERPTISPTPEQEQTPEDDVESFRRLLGKSPDMLDTIRSQVLSNLTGTGRVNLRSSQEYGKLHKLLSQTVLAGEGNSMFVIGSRGTGKTALVDSAISTLQEEHSQDFYVVRLNGFIQTDDKIALKEIWRQLGREMNVEDELMSGRSNYADILTSLLGLLSHEDEATLAGAGEDAVAAKSVIFILDEVHMFATHPRQTLLYNLFDLAQSSTTPLAIIGLTPRIDIVDLLEKRVKSRFGQRLVQMTHPRNFDTFKLICQDALTFRPPSPSFKDKLSKKESTATAEIVDAWNAYIPPLLDTYVLHLHLERIFATTRSPSTFFNSAIIAIASLSHETPLPEANQFVLTPLQPPDNDLQALLPSLSTLQLALLIAAARLEIILAPANSTSASLVGVNFEMAYEEYVTIASQTRVSASAAGQVGLGGAGARVWGRVVTRKEWEALGELGIIVPMGAGGGGRSGTGDGKWVVDLGGLEEIGGWIEGEGKGVERGLLKWCRI